MIQRAELVVCCRFWVVFPLRRSVIVLRGFAKWIGHGQQPIVIVVRVTCAFAQLVILPSFVPVSVIFEPLVFTVGVVDLCHQAASCYSCAIKVCDAAAVQCAVVFIGLGRDITAHVGRKRHRFHPINPAGQPVGACIIAVVCMRIGAARNAALLRIVFVGKQTAIVVGKTLPGAVCETMCEHLAETVVGESFEYEASVFASWG